jgi:hypothetical protein
LDAYLSSTTTALLGTQALIISALSGNGSRSLAGACGDFRIAAGYAGANPAAAGPASDAAWAAAAAAAGEEKKKDRRQLVKQISRRMKREVRVVYMLWIKVL